MPLPRRKLGAEQRPLEDQDQPAQGRHLPHRSRDHQRRHRIQPAPRARLSEESVCVAGRARQQLVDQLEKPDKNTIVLQSDKPRPGVFDFLQYLRILDKDTMEGPDAATKVVGTGSMMWKEWVPGDHITLVKNPNYWDSGRPYLDGIEINDLPRRAEHGRRARIRRARRGRPDSDSGRRAVEGRREVQDVRDARSRPVLLRHRQHRSAAHRQQTAAPGDQLRDRSQALRRQRPEGLWRRGARPAVGQDLARVRPGQEQHVRVRPGQGEVARAAVRSEQHRVRHQLGHRLATPPSIRPWRRSFRATWPRSASRPTSSRPIRQRSPSRATATIRRTTACGSAPAPSRSCTRRRRCSTLSRTFGYLSNLAGFYDDKFKDLVATASTEPDAAKRKQLYSQYSDFLLDASYAMVICPYPDIDLMRPNVEGLRWTLATNVPMSEIWLS